jgi:hypothetical protein
MKELGIILFFYAHAELTHQFLTRTLISANISSLHICSGHASVPDAIAQQHVLKGPFFQISSVCSVHKSVPDPYAQCSHKGRSIRVRKSIFLIMFNLKLQKF